MAKISNITAQLSPTRIWWLAVFISLALHWRIMPTDLSGKHLWRQSQTQINIRNFYRHDFNILNPRVDASPRPERMILRYEFPLMQWGIALVQKALGEHILITRTCLFLLGLLSFWGFFSLCKVLFLNDLIAMLASWAFYFSPLLFYYSINPIPDNLALCGAIWGLAWFFRWKNSQRWQHAVLAGICLSIGTAAKLPYIVFYATVGLYLLFKIWGSNSRSSVKYLLYGLLFFMLLVPTLAWYAWVIPGWEGNGIVNGVLGNKISWGRAGQILFDYLHYMFPNVIIGYAALPLFIMGCYAAIQKKQYQNMQFWFLGASVLAIAAYVGFELNMIGTAHDYYLMPTMIPIFLIVAYGIKNLWIGGEKGQKISLIALALCPVLAFSSTFISWNVDKNKDAAAIVKHQKALRDITPDDAACVMLNDESLHIFPYLLDKFGPVSSDDRMTPKHLKELIQLHHVRFLYSTSRNIDENPDFAPLLDSMLLEVEHIRVFQLKQL